MKINIFHGKTSFDILLKMKHAIRMFDDIQALNSKVKINDVRNFFFSIFDFVWGMILLNKKCFLSIRTRQICSDIELSWKQSVSVTFVDSASIDWLYEYYVLKRVFHTLWKSNKASRASYNLIILWKKLETIKSINWSNHQVGLYNLVWRL